MSGARDRWRYFPIRETPIFRETTWPDYWRGATATSEELDAWVAERDGNRVALLAEPSGLAPLDCDVEYDWRVQADGVSRLVKTRDGAADLRRVASELGKVIPATYAVRTPSGGLHVYFRQNARCRVTSHGHRDGWLVDVKASRNAYVVAPPSPGYEVVRDLPVAVMPYWLARYVQRIGLAGGRERRSSVPMTGQRRDGILRAVDESNAVGGWNCCIYWAARRLLEAGEDVIDEARWRRHGWQVWDEGLTETGKRLLEAAAPWDEREAGHARRTIESAWRGHLNEKSFH